MEETNLLPIREKQVKLDMRYLEMAQIWATNSYCTRRQVGALIVKEKMIISDGYNGTPSGLRMFVKTKMEKLNRMFYTQRPMPLPK